MFNKKNTDNYTKIANEILAASESVSDSVLNVLIKLYEKYPTTTYWICRKFLQEYHRIFIADIGHIGISDRLLHNVMYPGDIVIYAAPEKIKSGDIVQLIFLGEKEENINISHAKVLSFNTDGSIHVKDISSDNEYTIRKWNILGKLIKTIEFESKEWKELFLELGIEKKWIKETIENIVENIKASDTKEKEKLIKELNIRLSKLK